MSTLAETVTATSAAGRARKNTHRLNRIFRKPKVTLASRKWRSDEEAAVWQAGVPSERLHSLIGALTQEERTRAAAGMEPLSAIQDTLLKRAARFGLPIEPPANTVPNKQQQQQQQQNSSRADIAHTSFTVDEETLRRREARFKTPEQVEREAAMEQRIARFGQTQQSPAPTLATAKMSEEDRNAMEARERRFAAK